MYEYTLTHISTGERKIVFGYSWQDAIHRANIQAEDWDIEHEDYVD